MSEKIPLAVDDNPLKEARIIVPCLNCVFAKYTDTTQTGCAADQLDKLKENGAEIVEAENGTFEFYLIKNRLCMMRREKNWREKIGNKKSILELIDVARQEVLNRCTAEVIVYVIDDDPVKIGGTLDSIYKEEIAPNRISFILNGGVKLSKMVTTIKSLIKPSIPWTVEAIVERDKNGNRVDARRAIDIFANTKVKYPYFVTLEAGKRIQQGVVGLIRHRLVDKMEMLMHEFGEEMGIHNEIVNTDIFKFLHGNCELPIGEKIRGLTNEQS
jgi:hypothetical protein